VSLLNGGNAIFTISGTISETLTGLLANTASVTSPPEIGDLFPDNNSATDIDYISELIVNKTSDAGGCVDPGDTITYTINVTNGGDTSA